MKITDQVIEKIKAEDKYHHFEEYGGYLVIDNNTITDIIFDMNKQTPGYVRLGVQKITKIPENQQDKVHGWFHKHPIQSVSQMDIHTMLNLTNFWGECHTLVLQSNKRLLYIKTVKGNDIVFGTPTIVETERSEKDLYPYKPLSIFKMFSSEPQIPTNPDCQKIPPDQQNDPVIPSIQESTPTAPPNPPPEEQQPFCLRCGILIPPDSLYCQYCGVNQEKEAKTYQKRIKKESKIKKVLDWQPRLYK